MSFYRLTAKGHTQEGELWTFTLHCQNISGTLAGAAAAWHTAMGLLWNGVATPADSIKQLVPTTVGCDATVADQLDPLTGKNDAQLSTLETLVGTNATDQWPAQDSVAVTLRTAKATKAGRGRFFLPPFSENEALGARITATAQGQIKTAAQKMIQSLNGAGYIVGVFHRLTILQDAVVSVDVADVIRTQRRRTDKLIPTRSSATV
jgi:hypothetical protein